MRCMGENFTRPSSPVATNFDLSFLTSEFYMGTDPGMPGVADYV